MMVSTTHVYKLRSTGEREKMHNETHIPTLHSSIQQKKHQLIQSYLSIN